MNDREYQRALVHAENAIARREDGFPDNLPMDVVMALLEWAFKHHCQDFAELYQVSAEFTGREIKSCWVSKDAVNEALVALRNR